MVFVLVVVFVFVKDAKRPCKKQEVGWSDLQVLDHKTRVAKTCATCFFVKQMKLFFHAAFGVGQFVHWFGPCQIFLTGHNEVFVDKLAAGKHGERCGVMALVELNPV